MCGKIPHTHNNFIRIHFRLQSHARILHIGVAVGIFRTERRNVDVGNIPLFRYTIAVLKNPHMQMPCEEENAVIVFLQKRMQIVALFPDMPFLPNLGKYVV